MPLYFDPPGNGGKHSIKLVFFKFNSYLLLLSIVGFLWRKDIFKLVGEGVGEGLTKKARILSHQYEMNDEPFESLIEIKHDNKASTIFSLFVKMVHIIALGLPVVIIWIAQPGLSAIFPWHPTLMAVGFGFLMTEAILVFSPQSSMLPTSTRATKAQIHWLIQILAITCTSLGFAAIYYNKYRHGKNHFTSWHGLCGLITMVMVLLQAFQGISIYFPRFSLIKASLGQRKQLHALVGVLVFTLACCTIVLGYFSNWFLKNVNDAVWWGSVLSTLAMTGVIMGQVANEIVARNKPIK